MKIVNLYQKNILILAILLHSASAGSTFILKNKTTFFSPIESERCYWGYYSNPGSRLDPSREMLEETLETGYPLFLTEDNNWASGLSPGIILEKIPGSGIVEFAIKDPGHYLFLNYSLLN